MSNDFTMTIPEIYSINGASTVTGFCSFGLISTFSFGKKQNRTVQMLKQESCESMTLSSSQLFLNPRTKSTFSGISETKVKISNM